MKGRRKENDIKKTFAMHWESKVRPLPRRVSFLLIDRFSLRSLNKYNSSQNQLFRTRFRISPNHRSRIRTLFRRSVCGCKKYSTEKRSTLNLNNGMERIFFNYNFFLLFLCLCFALFLFFFFLLLKLFSSFLPGWTLGTYRSSLERFSFSRPPTDRATRVHTLPRRNHR